MKMLNNRQQGFTLIELIMVIVILGILAATALPKFVDLSSDARESKMEGLAGGIRGAVSIVKSKYIITGTTPVPMDDGSTVVVGQRGAARGVPVAGTTGIQNAIDYSGFTPTTTDTTTPQIFEPDGKTGVATCRVFYDSATGAVKIVTQGC